METTMLCRQRDRYRNKAMRCRVCREDCRIHLSLALEYQKVYLSPGQHWLQSLTQIISNKERETINFNAQ